jgi:polyferredoxin
MRILRMLVQALFLGGVVALLIRGLTGATPNTCEYYCPFGGLVALYPLIRYRAYTCALTEFNVALLVSVVILALVSKKSFCGWVCPLGTVQDWIGRLGGKVFRRRYRPPHAADRALMMLRYAVLAAVPILTFTLWKFDLGFRAYDPFYILFTWGGHETNAASLYVVIGVLAAALFVPFMWCRYLCPMGAALDPFSRAGALRLRRNKETCTDCGVCDRACPHAIPVSKLDEVTARNCTNCLECAEACPREGTLELSWFGK